MCSIIGSFDKNKIIELAMLNAYRGQHSYSIAYYNPFSANISFLERGLGPLPINNINIPDNQYCIVHQQAPTTSLKDSTIHPAQIGKQLLWHNGIIKAEHVKKMQKDLYCSHGWDTYLILRQIKDTDNPDGIDGTFACLWYDESGLSVFRNEISPLFYDKDFNLSSTKVDGFDSIPANQLLLFEPLNKTLDLIREFKTVENPYYFYGGA